MKKLEVFDMLYKRINGTGESYEIERAKVRTGISLSFLIGILTWLTGWQ